MKTIDCCGINVSYEQKHHGGGIRWAPDFVNIIGERAVPIKRCAEFCSGPGFIGFSLLGAGLIDELVLLDINPDVAAGIEQTFASNRTVRSRVTFICSDGIGALASAGSPFDLIVANPPHIDVLDPRTGPIPYDDHPILYSDPGFSIHRRFFREFSSCINPGGYALFIENGLFSDLTLLLGGDEFLELKFDMTIPCSHKDFYWLEIGLNRTR